MKNGKKPAAPKTEPKVKATVKAISHNGLDDYAKEGLKEIMEQMKQSSDVPNEPHEWPSVEEQKKAMKKHGEELDKEAIFGDWPKTKFAVGDKIKRDHRLWECISMNGVHDATFALYHHQNNRVDKSITMTVSNDPSVTDIQFERYS